MAKTSDGTRDQPQFASSGNTPDFAADLTVVSDFFAPRALRRFTTVALLLASSGSNTDDYAVATNAPGALFRNTGAGWRMYGVPEFADSAARATALSAPVAGWRSRLLDTGLDYIYSGSAWVIAGAVIPTAGVTGSGSSVSVDPATGVVTFTNALTLTLDGLSADYREFEIDYVCKGTAATLLLNLRTAVPADVSTNYDHTTNLARNAGVASATTAAATSWPVMSIANTHMMGKITLANLGAALETMAIINAGVHSNPAVQNATNGVVQVFGTHRDATAYAGVKLTFSAAQSGTLRLRGLR